MLSILKVTMVAVTLTIFSHNAFSASMPDFKPAFNNKVDTFKSQTLFVEGSVKAVHSGTVEGFDFYNLVLKAALKNGKFVNIYVISDDFELILDPDEVKNLVCENGSYSITYTWRVKPSGKEELYEDVKLNALSRCDD